MFEWINWHCDVNAPLMKRWVSSYNVGVTLSAVDVGRPSDPVQSSNPE